MAEVKISVLKVKTHREMRLFINFPYKLYRDNQFWCPPPKFDEWNTFSRKKNPAFDFCEAEYWLAFRNGELSGRVAGIINRNANARWNENLVRFGWIDFIDDYEVYKALISQVTEWGREKGMSGIHGPLGFTDMDPEGMLIEGFDQPSSLSAIYNYPYYPDFMERDGFLKAVDWVQYRIPVPAQIPEKVERMSNISASKYGLRQFHALKKKDLYPYARKMFEMQNKSFIDLYGFSALTDRQMDLYTKQYFGFIRKEFVSIVVDKEDEIVAFGITIPDMGDALRKCGGKLFPLGFLGLLKAMNKNNHIHMYLVGVRPDYHGKGVLAMIFKDLHEAYLKEGIRVATTHPQLEENFRALSIWKNYESEINIRRRCWVKNF